MSIRNALKPAVIALSGLFAGNALAQECKVPFNHVDIHSSQGILDSLMVNQVSQWSGELLSRLDVDTLAEIASGLNDRREKLEKYADNALDIVANNLRRGRAIDWDRIKMQESPLSIWPVLDRLAAKNNLTVDDVENARRSAEDAVRKYNDDGIAKLKEFATNPQKPLCLVYEPGQPA